jgi:hypothetical protein
LLEKPNSQFAGNENWLSPYIGEQENLVNQPVYTTEASVTTALANGTFAQHHDNCVKAYAEAIAWQKYLKQLSRQKFFFRRKAKPCNTSRNFTFQFSR